MKLSERLKTKHLRKARTLNHVLASASDLDRAYRACEQLAGRDKPHLYAAAGLFGNAQTRRAFVATYASMRIIDDAIDDIPNRAELSSERRDEELRRIENWLDQVRRSHQGHPSESDIWLALTDTFARFRFPLGPWIHLAQAMSADVHSSTFDTWAELKQYMQGASVAPATVFMYLVIMKQDGDGTFSTNWSYERVHGVTEDLAVFCYSVHILRDVAIDLSLGESGLVYLPREDLARFGLSVRDLYQMRDAGRCDDRYRKLARYQASRAREHLRRGRERMDAVLEEAGDSQGRALTVLVDTYERVLNNLQDRDFDVFLPEAAAAP